MRLFISLFLVLAFVSISWAHGDEVHEESISTEEATEIPAIQTPMESENVGVGTPPDNEGHHAGEIHAEHDHSAHAHGTWATNPAERLLAWIGRFHPALTNFPIALLIAAVFAEAFSVLHRGSAMRPTVAFLGTWGGIAAIVTAVVGWLYVGVDWKADDVLLSSHRLVGSIAGAAGLAVTVLSIGSTNKDDRLLLRLALLFAAASVAYNGYVGGQMMYGTDHYNWPG